MTKFLPDERPVDIIPQNADQHQELPTPTTTATDTGATLAGTTTATTAIPTPPPTETASDGHKESDATAVNGGERIPSVPHSKRSSAGKAPAAAMAGGGGSEGGTGSNSNNSSAISSGSASGDRAGYLSGSGSGGGGSGGSVFCDEASAGGAGLAVSSPADLEPFLRPAPSSLSTAAASTTFDGTPTEKGPATGAGAGATGSSFSSSSPSPTAAISAANANANGPGSTATSGGAYVLPGQGMLPSRSPSGSGAMGGGAGDDRLWLVYEGVSAAGKGVISKVNAPDPYWLGRASPGVVCPHAHSMEFHASFESANLLRAVQVREAVLVACATEYFTALLFVATVKFTRFLSEVRSV